MRRLFFIDTTLSRSTAGGSDGAPQAVLFPSRLDLLVQVSTVSGTLCVQSERGSCLPCGCLCQCQLRWSVCIPSCPLIPGICHLGFLLLLLLLLLVLQIQPDARSKIRPPLLTIKWVSPGRWLARNAVVCS